MGSGIVLVERKKVTPVLSKKEARNRFEWEKTKQSALFFGSLALSALFPPLGASLSLISGYEFSKFWSKFFSTKQLKEYYYRLFSPKVSRKHLVSIGYEVYPEDLEEHENILDGLDDGLKEAIKKAQVREKAVKTRMKWKEVGINKKRLTKHWWIIGTTGAGKTSFIMTLIKEQMKNGGGVIFVDGKADEAMNYKMYSLAEKEGRTHDYYLINFLNTDKFKSDTNTFNPIANASAFSIVEFFSTLKGEPTGDQAYWFGRGLALLRPIVLFWCFRRDFYGENFTFQVLAETIDVLDKFTMIGGITHALVLALENKLAGVDGISALFEKAKLSKGVVHGEFPIIDSLVYHYSLNPQERVELQMKGIDFDYMENLWKVYTEIQGYTAQIYPDWQKIMKSLGEELYGKFHSKVLKVNIEELRQSSSELISSRYQLDMNKAGDAIMQHGYAQQQWKDIFSTLEVYSHVFSTNTPDVDMLDVLKNQKLLYVLLPPLKQSPKTTNLLGRIILTAIRLAVSTALGGPVENLTSEQKQILKDRITPRPLGLVIFDEYGAYPVDGIDTLLAQVRSINVSVVLSTQDYVSAKVDGTKEHSVLRAWANTQKLVLGIQDYDTLQKLESLLKEKYVMREGLSVVGEEFLKKVDVSIEKEREFKPQELVRFKNGAALMISDDPVIVQTYWADAPPAKFIKLNKVVYSNLNNLSETKEEASQNRG